jgi:hypothetical protein
MYEKYIEVINDAVARKDITQFKNQYHYTGVLEHVSYDLGFEYLHNILKNTKISYQQIQDFCAKNDKVGSPKLHTYPKLKVSPSSLRYIYHAHLILTYLKARYTNPDHEHEIVEVGGGYGGLFLAIDHFAKLYNVKIKSYDIIDLPEVIKLQDLVLGSYTDIQTPYKLHPSYTYGLLIHKENMFMISNFCFSALEKQDRDKYVKFLLPKVTHGFMAWNFIPVYDFKEGTPLHVENEVPLTGPAETNRYVYF